MKKAMVVGLMALAGFGVSEGQGAETADYKVTVYLQDHQLAEPLVLARARALTTSMFARVGVHLRWKIGRPPPGRGCQPLPNASVVVRFTYRTPTDHHPGASAYSFPYAPQSEVRVKILYDRVLAAAGGDRNDTIAFLGHVLTHEIAHVLQGLPRHSADGVMKAHWGLKDRREMRKAPLPFTADDVGLIQRTLGALKCEVELAAQ